MSWRRSNEASGFTVIELIIALTLGTIVIAAAIRYVITEFRVLTANEIREEVTRNGRYMAVSLRRDLQRAGVGIETTKTFGTVDTWPGAPRGRPPTSSCRRRGPTIRCRPAVPVARSAWKC